MTTTTKMTIGTYSKFNRLLIKRGPSGNIGEAATSAPSGIMSGLLSPATAAAVPPSALTPLSPHMAPT